MKSSKLQAALDRIDKRNKEILKSINITDNSKPILPSVDRTTFITSPITPQIVPLIKLPEIEVKHHDIPTNQDTIGSSNRTDNTEVSRYIKHEPIQSIERIDSYDNHEEFLNSHQLEATNRIISGESICLIGKAGTGKTTAIRETVKRLLQSAKLPIIKSANGHKYLREGYFGVVCCAFTNRATNNIAKGFNLAETPIHFITVHKLLEYYKEEYVTKDEKSGLPKKSFRFVPGRDRYNPLPSGIKLIILEESSQINKQDLHAKLMEACYGRNIQFVYLGDLQQLPPIGGDGILGYKINELPTIELTQIYRQAAENPIIRLAWEVASGSRLKREYLIENYSKSKDLTSPIQIRFWEQKLDWEEANILMGNFFCDQIDKGIFNWDHGDIILMPYNKKFGTIELNKRIAEHLSQHKRRSPTYEIIAGFQKHYYSPGDKVLYNKKEGIIRKISRNGKYIGRTPLPPDIGLSRDGSYSNKGKGTQTVNVGDNGHIMSDEELDQYLKQMEVANLDEEAQNQSSHLIDIDLIDEQMADGSTSITLSTRGELSELELAYAISIHKSQGSEWRKVFLILHNTHHQLNREMLYTAITRASKQLFIICESDSFIKAVGRQRIPGDTLERKKEWFREKMNLEAVQTNGNGDED